MKTFLVNLDSATARLAFMQEQLDRLSVPFERVPAVVGKSLPEAEVSRNVDRFKQWCARGCIMKLGEIGCSLSHIAIWKRMQTENIPVACVLEDDVTVMDNFPKWLADLSRRAKPDEPAVYLLSGRKIDGEKGGVHLISDEQHTCGYVVTKRGAALLLACNTPIVYPCDTWKVWVSCGLHFYKCVPKCIGHYNRAQFGSMNDGVPSSRTNRLVHILKRLIGKPLDVIFCAALKQKVKGM